ncbi:hypothetical protein [Snodgrassella sp. ESL0324]|uniref:hypothetical protein n=1 Tax=Snodgrassella sp. ESL0324 TaxID=2705033 RepID=UPI001581868D|nr:hypothetical protein [Snodgrassella sp. ESL0324]NUF08972.1 hypothetical protein [Snodgrassella sp. ESL0324]
MARNNQQNKSDQVDNTEQPEQLEQDAGVDLTDTVEQPETTDTVEQPETTDTVEQPETTKQETIKQKPPKDNPAMETEKAVSKLPKTVKVRVTHGYDLLHPYTNKCVKTELQEFPCDNWMLAQLQAGFVDMYTITNERLLWKCGKLVYAK